MEIKWNMNFTFGALFFHSGSAMSGLLAFRAVQGLSARLADVVGAETGIANESAGTESTAESAEFGLRVGNAALVHLGRRSESALCQRIGEAAGRAAVGGVGTADGGGRSAAETSVGRADVGVAGRRSWKFQSNQCWVTDIYTAEPLPNGRLKN